MCQVRFGRFGAILNILGFRGFHMVWDVLFHSIVSAFVYLYSKMVKNAKGLSHVGRFSCIVTTGHRWTWEHLWNFDTWMGTLYIYRNKSMLLCITYFLYVKGSNKKYFNLQIPSQNIYCAVDKYFLNGANLFFTVICNV